MEIKKFESLPPLELIAEINQLHSRIFGPYDIWEDLGVKRSPLVLIASVDGQFAGYKIGYERKEHQFYSWIGAVVPCYRKQGIGSRLMEIQHQWCLEKGYRSICTKTKNKWRQMLILNLRSGFDITGLYMDEKGEPKLILEKRLDSAIRGSIRKADLQH